jgi:hypothetical protein
MSCFFGATAGSESVPASGHGCIDCRRLAELDGFLFEADGNGFLMHMEQNVGGAHEAEVGGLGDPVFTGVC